MAATHISLWSLSTDVMEMITSLLPGGCILHLWCSGDRKLQQNLAFGGVVRMRLKDRTTNSTSRYPLALSQFRGLKHLRLDRHSERLDDPEKISLELRKLTPKLETLKLYFQQAEQCLLKEFDYSRLVQLFSEDAVDTSASETIVGSAPEEPESPFWNISQFFPRLASFCLSGSHPQLRNEDLAMLPRSLTQLKSEYPTLLTPDCILYLPPGLTSLHIQSSQINTLPPLPRALKELALTASIAALSMNIEWPPELESLKDGTFSGATTAAIERLPKTVTKINPFSSMTWSETDYFLLTGLTELTIIKSMRIDGAFISQLSRNIRKIHIRNYSTSDFCDIEPRHWPPKLLSLRLTTACNVLPDFVDTLPHSVTILELPNVTFRTGLASPRKLKKDPENNPPPLGLPSDTDAPSTGLAWSDWDVIVHQASSRTLQVFSLEHVEAAKFSSERITALPRGLTSLTLRRRLYWRETMFRAMPPSLTQLTLHWAGGPDSEAALLALAPAGIRDFTLDMTDGGGEALNTLVKALPRGLEKLTLDTQHGIVLGANDVALLPRGLICLRLNLVCLEPTSKCIRALPETLITLVTNTTAWPGQLTGDLPRGLSYFSSSGSWTLLEDDHLSLLPRSLQTFTMAHPPDQLTEKGARNLPSSFSVYSAFGLRKAGFAYRSSVDNMKGLRLVTPDPRVVARFQGERH